jgi:hypothetical protein
MCMICLMLDRCRQLLYCRKSWQRQLPKHSASVQCPKMYVQQNFVNVKSYNLEPMLIRCLRRVLSKQEFCFGSQKMCHQMKQADLTDMLKNAHKNQCLWYDLTPASYSINCLCYQDSR